MINQNLIYLSVILIVVNLCKADIKLIQIVTRHGARYPADLECSLDVYPNDPNTEESYAPNKPMELTKIGRNKAYKLGLFLQRRYPTLNESLVHIRALNESRTIDTARLLATGLFSSTQEPWNPKLPLADEPITVMPKEEDTLNSPMFSCENYKIDKDQAYAQVKRLFGAFRGIQDLYKFLSNHTGVEYKVTLQGFFLYHQLTAESSIGLSLEPWTKEVFPDGKLLDIIASEYIIQTYTTRMKRLSGGVYVKKILDNVDEFLVNKNNNNNNINEQMKGYIYTCSELQIAAILNTLGIYKPHVPDYLSTILLELHEINDEYYIKVIYKNAGNMEDMVIPGCKKSLCLLSTFRSVLKDVTMKNLNEECGKWSYRPLIKTINESREYNKKIFD